MKNATLLFFFCVLFVKSSVAEFQPPVIDPDEVRVQCAALLSDSRTLRMESHFAYSLLFKNDSTAYYNPQGTLHLFEITVSDSGTKVKLLRDARYNGHNFGRHLFMHDGGLYSLGGSGLFNSTPSLVKFDFNVNEWYLVEVKDVPGISRGVLFSWLKGDKLFVCFQNHNGNKADLKEKDISYGYIDMLTMGYHELAASRITPFDRMMRFGNGSRIYESRLFDIFQTKVGESVFYLFNKENGNMIQHSFLNQKPGVTGKSSVYTKDSTIFYRDESGVVDSMPVGEGTVYYSIAYHDFLLGNSSTSNDSTFLLRPFFISLALIIFIFGGYFFYRRSKAKTLNKNQDEYYALRTKLMKFKGQTLSREKLDELLDISQLSPDSAKSLRSKMLTSINASGEVTVKRVRNKEDKRSFDYSVM